MAILEEYSKKDGWIKHRLLSKNSGVAVARNSSSDMASGRYITYLDSDDVWDPTKVELQVMFMVENSSAFSCASCRVIDGSGMDLDKTVKMLERTDYRGFLLNNLLQTVGIMVDTEKTGRSCLVMPNLRRRQDAATWLQVLENDHICYRMSDVLCSYRRVSGSLSSEKCKAAKGVWFLYRKVERLPFLFSCKCFVRYAVLVV